MQYRYLDSPVGRLLLAGEGETLCFVGFPQDGECLEPQSGWVADEQSLTRAVAQLLEYFAGERRDFDLDLKPNGTRFQLDVLEALTRIPYGETRSYADVAGQVGRPKAVRAVGAANGRNPLPIVIPCHRVIGANGALTGFGGGLEAKRTLLELESDQRRIL